MWQYLRKPSLIYQTPIETLFPSWFCICNALARQQSAKCQPQIWQEYLVSVLLVTPRQTRRMLTSLMRCECNIQLLRIWWRFPRPFTSPSLMAAVIRTSIVCSGTVPRRPSILRKVVPPLSCRVFLVLPVISIMASRIGTTRSQLTENNVHSNGHKNVYRYKKFQISNSC